MINNHWQSLGVGLLDTRETVRIIVSNTARIDLPMWLRSEPYLSTELTTNVSGFTLTSSTVGGAIQILAGLVIIYYKLLS